MVKNHIALSPDPSFNPARPGRVDFFEQLSAEEKADLIAQDPNYGEIICRCEKITKREVLDAIQNPLGKIFGVMEEIRKKAPLTNYGLIFL